MPRKTDSNNPADWVFIAEADLRALKRLAEIEEGHSLCRSKLAEVLEKIIKAELIRLGWALAKTHDLERLHLELEDWRSELATSVAPLCDDLAEAYFADRYPGFDLDEADWPKLRGQLQQVQSILDVVKNKLRAPSGAD